MTLLFDSALQIFIALVVSWAAFFGPLGALLAHLRGGSWLEGLAWGIAIGPFGWIAIRLRTKDGGGHWLGLVEPDQDSWEAL